MIDTQALDEAVSRFPRLLHLCEFVRMKYPNAAPARLDHHRRPYALNYAERVRAEYRRIVSDKRRAAARNAHQPSDAARAVSLLCKRRKPS